MYSRIRDFIAAATGAQAHAASTDVLIVIGILLTAVAFYYLSVWVLYALERLVDKSPTKWDDDMLNHRLARGVSQLSPAIWISVMLPRFFTGDGSEPIYIIDVVTRFYVLWAVVRIIVILIDNLYGAFVRRENLQAYAIKGIFQMAKLVVFGIGTIIGVSILINKTPVAILTALGASAAVLMLVFKDTILGLVASVQLSANRMVTKGDWISMPSHGANGTVEDVSLTTVKVRNFDNTVTTVPPYSLVSESFRNHQTMAQYGGRRVCRAFYIDANTVRFSTPDEMERLRSLGFLPADFKASERCVNLQLLRGYLERYIASLPVVNTSLTNMVRQLDPTPSGLPVEVYFFTRTTEWIEFEHIQADVFDHIYAVIPAFGLAVFQSPAGRDFTPASN